MDKKSVFMQLSSKAKLGYIWDYYKWCIILSIAFLVIIVDAVYSHITYVEPVLNVSIINAHLDSEEYNFDDFLGTQEGDKEENPIFVDTNLILTGELGSSYTSIQTLHSYTISGSIDIFVWCDDVICAYFAKCISLDLSEVFSNEMMDCQSIEVFYSDGSDGEMPYPCYVKINNCEWAKMNFDKDYCYVAFSCNPINLETAADFVDYLLDDG